jgi:hypothetical protein
MAGLESQMLSTSVLRSVLPMSVLGRRDLAGGRNKGPAISRSTNCDGPVVNHARGLGRRLTLLSKIVRLQKEEGNSPPNARR